MRLKQLLVIAVAVGGTLSGVAQTVVTTTTTGQSSSTSYWGDRFRYDRTSTTLYNANELSLDLFGTYATRDKVGNSGANWGGGLGVNYFFNRYIGIGADSYLEEWRWPYRVNGNAMIRFPIDQIGLAPY